MPRAARMVIPDEFIDEELKQYKELEFIGSISRTAVGRKVLS